MIVYFGHPVIKNISYYECHVDLELFPYICVIRSPNCFICSENCVKVWQYSQSELLGSWLLFLVTINALRNKAWKERRQWSFKLCHSKYDIVAQHQTLRLLVLIIGISRKHDLQLMRTYLLHSLSFLGFQIIRSAFFFINFRTVHLILILQLASSFSYTWYYF